MGKNCVRLFAIATTQRPRFLSWKSPFILSTWLAYAMAFSALKVMTTAMLTQYYICGTRAPESLRCSLFPTIITTMLIVSLLDLLISYHSQNNDYKDSQNCVLCRGFWSKTAAGWGRGLHIEYGFLEKVCNIVRVWLWTQCWIYFSDTCRSLFIF